MLTPVLRPTLPLLVALALAGPATAQAVDPDTGDAALADLAEAAREARSGLSFEDFRDQTTYIPETGKYYVNGDTPIRNEKLLREFWEQNVRNKPVPPMGETPEFTVINVGGLDQLWGPVEKHNLTYCVSTAFGSRHALVVGDMQAAAAAWEAVADLDFSYIASQDGDCDAANDEVMFDVRPVNAGGQFLAAAFFPNDPREARSVVIDPSSFSLDPNGNLTLRGILRHELGHVIGARHEHVRPEAGACFEDNDWRGVTDYDAFSVMHYPQCNGLGDWSLRLTETDKSGVACLYGAAAGFTIDTDICTPEAGTNAPESESFGPFTVAQGETRLITSVPVTPGTVFRAEMTGSGDPDLYVKLDGPALISSYDCRPYTSGAEETCDFVVPANRSTAFIAVHGYTDGEFTVTVTATAPLPQ
ncbi:MAG: matrixin family metalloprotease [Pseudooceanicola atlanticus]